MFFGPYTGASISFDKDSIAINQGNPTVLPLDRTIEHPLDFFGIYRQQKRSTVVPKFNGELNIKNGKISIKGVESEIDLPDEERLKRCRQFVQGAIYAWYRKNYTRFEASLCMVVETCNSLPKQWRVVKAVLDEEEIRQHHKRERTLDPASYKNSCERMVEKLDTLLNYTINKCLDQQ